MNIAEWTWLSVKLWEMPSVPLADWTLLRVPLTNRTLLQSRLHQMERPRIEKKLSNDLCQIELM